LYPSYVPAAGAVASFTTGGGTLTNQWNDIFDPTAIGYEPFYARKISTDYSSQFLHTGWRNFGGLVFWGGGHSATNYNGMTIVSFNESTITFECLQVGTAWTGGVLDTGNNSSQADTTYGEATTGGSSPLKLVSPHSYGCGDIVDGFFVQVFGQAWGHSNWGSNGVAHHIDLTDPSTSYSTRSWVRRTNNTHSATWTSPEPNMPVNTCYVPAQNRIFAVMRGGGGPYTVRWFDLSSNTYVVGSGTGFNFGDGTTDAGCLFLAENRNLLICCYRNGSGNLVIEYMNVASGVSQPTLGGTATLSSTLTIPSDWGAATYCTHSGQIQVFGVTSNTDKVYEIDIPTTLSNTWTVSTAGSLPSSATITPLANGVYGKGCQYNPLTRCCAFFESGLSETGNDTIKLYRPRFT
jgi:hypothetical protein